MDERTVRRIGHVLTLVSALGWLATFFIKSSVRDRYFIDKPTLTVTLGLSAWLVLFVVPIAGYALASTSRATDVLAVRVRRVVTVCAAASLIGILPGFLTTRYHNLEEAMGLAMFFLIVVGPSVFVYAAPTRKSALAWSVWLLPLGALMWSIGFEPKHEWRERMVQVSLGTVLALGVVVLPIVALTARRRGSLPEARVR